MAVCSKCHQQISVERAGVRMPPFKARIFDMVAAAGDGGISSAELTSGLYRGYVRLRSPSNIKAHVGQINNRLTGTAWAIRSEGPGPHARWYLRRRPMQEAAE